MLTRRGGQSPLVDPLRDSQVTLFDAVGAMAIADGVLVQMIVLARLFYGMAQRRQFLPYSVESTRKREHRLKAPRSQAALSWRPRCSSRLKGDLHRRMP